jgi:hypothetical protein
VAPTIQPSFARFAATVILTLPASNAGGGQSLALDWTDGRLIDRGAAQACQSNDRETVVIPFHGQARN